MKDGTKPIDCPARVAKTYLARRGYWRVPPLLGIISAPTLRRDGSILSASGYDSATGLWFDPGHFVFEPVPENLSQEDARQALEVLKEPIVQFPWLEPSDRSAALAAMLTALVRHSLRTAPLTAFRAPKMGSGKSLLADVVGMVATGGPVAVMSQGKDEAEDKKRLLAILIEGTPVACIDNIERPFGSEALCSVLTQQYWRDRILGLSQTASVPTTTTWLATGNNIVFVGDITTRVVPCDLDPKCEHPEARTYRVNLYDWVPENRGRLVIAGLTVLRAYHLAGRPNQRLDTFGRFEEWSDLVRSALVWCGEADPCAGRRRLEDTDPVRGQLQRLLVAWEGSIGSEKATVKDIIAQADPNVCGGEGGDLWHALLEVCGKAGKPDGRRLGNFLSKYERRLEGGLRFERAGDRQRSTLWRCVRVDPQPPTLPAETDVSSVSLVSPFRSDGIAVGVGSALQGTEHGRQQPETDSRNARNSPAENRGDNGNAGASQRDDNAAFVRELRRALSDAGALEAADDRAEPSVPILGSGRRPCFTCGGTGLWKRKDGDGRFLCSRCHPPQVEQGEIEFAEVGT